MNSTPPAPLWNKDERLIITLVAAVHFVHFVDFMIVMPLGPDFSRTIGMEPSLIGIVGGTYTLAAAVATLICFRFIDRFDRKKSFVYSVSGLAITTGLTAVAQDFHSLLFWRALAGLFGGPVTALALAIVTDAISVDKRGRALGLVMAAFSVAAVVGLPIGLELARFFGWPSPFIVVGGVTGLLALLIHLYLPDVKNKLADTSTPLSLNVVMTNRRYRLGLALTFIAVFAIFLLVPHLSAYWQFNRGYPREQLGLLYMAGGVAAFFMSRAAGRLIDSRGAMFPLVLSCAGLIALTFLAFTAELKIPVFLLFVLYMGLSSGRAVPAQMLSTMVPTADRRAGYMSLQSATQSLGIGSASVLSSFFINTNPDQSLTGIPMAGLMSIAALLLVIWLGHKLTLELTGSTPQT